MTPDTVKLCACNCGLPTPISTHTNKRLGFIKGVTPLTYRKGHHNGKHSGKGKGTPEYAAYLEAKKRCNPNVKDLNLRRQYSERGIKFLFTSFEQFLNEVGPRPSVGHTLDRKYNDGNYEPGNIRWATRQEQRLNQRGSCSIHGPFSCPHCAAEHK